MASHLRRGTPAGGGRRGALEVEGEVAVLEHDTGVFGSESGGLRAQVGVNCIGAPAADEFDGVFVDVATKEGSGTARAETGCGNLRGIDASVGVVLQSVGVDLFLGDRRSHCRKCKSKNRWIFAGFGP